MRYIQHEPALSPFGRRAFLWEKPFNTSMTGYQEVFTDPSYYGQILIETYIPPPEVECFDLKEVHLLDLNAC